MILLDTHAWIWLLADPNELSPAAMRAVDGADRLALSAISVWELYLLVKKGRLKLAGSPTAFIASTKRDSRFEIVPVDAEIAARSIELPDIHADPADRIILATAEQYGCPVVSKDERFGEYGLARVTW